ncbi:Pyridoxal 5'-phosphate synthase subunit snz1 [Dissophora ornata]|nr:Pyridoxal 5'-phosphate synthase subunit snz1 [Dissophora ornata]
MSDDFKNPHLDNEEDKNTLILTAAAKGAGLALVAGGLVAFSGKRYSKTYQTLSQPMKTFLLSSGVAATTVLFADHARVQYEDRQLLRHLDQEAADAARAEIRAQRGVMAEMMYQIRENRNMVVGVSWLSCMVASLAYTFSKKGLTTTQRIVTARGVARMSDPKMIREIINAVSIPVMAKVRIGHFVEAQIIESLGVDYIDESEVLTPADEANHISKHGYKVPFVCGAKNLGEALRRINEGAAMIRTKGEAGTGNVVEAVRHCRTVKADIRKAQLMDDSELFTYSKEIQAPYHLLKETAKLGRLPVVNFAAGGVATPADAALMMQLGCDGVFVGSGIFKSGDPAKRAKAIVQAVTHFQDAKVLAEVSEDLGEAMVGINISEIPEDQLYAKRGW